MGQEIPQKHKKDCTFSFGWFGVGSQGLVFTMQGLDHVPRPRITFFSMSFILILLVLIN
jgi:hypothetical protein